jgi:hypothetical protein
LGLIKQQNSAKTMVVNPFVPAPLDAKWLEKSGTEVFSPFNANTFIETSFSHLTIFPA